MKGKFLVVQYAGKPVDPKQTSKKGYLKDNLVYDEKVSLTNKLRDKDLLNSTIVLDLENKKIVRRSKVYDISDNYNFLYESKLRVGLKVGQSRIYCLVARLVLAKQHWQKY